MNPWGKPMVAIVAVVIATVGARSALAGGPVRPDPNPAGTASGLGPDPAPGSARPAPVAQREVPRAVRITPAQPGTSSSAARTVTPRRVVRPRHVRTRPNRSRVARSATRRGGAASRATRTAPRTPRLAARLRGVDTESPTRAPLFMAAAALAAAVLASASLLALTRRRSLERSA